MIAAYIQAAPAAQQAPLHALYQLLKPLLPDAAEKISYGMPTFWQGENLVHFAAMKHHLGFYPTPDVITRFAEELKPYKTSKGAVQLPYDQPLPRALIQAMVRYRLTLLKK